MGWQVGQKSASAKPLAWSNVGIRPESLQVGQGKRARASETQSLASCNSLRPEYFESQLALIFSFAFFSNVRSWVIWSGVIFDVLP